MSGNNPSLHAKLRALQNVANRAGLPPKLLELCIKRMTAGHHEHGDAGMAAFDWRAELQQELADIANYVALGLVRGEAGRVNLAALGRGIKMVLEAIR